MADVKLDSKTYTFDDLEKKYRGFMAPAFEVIIDGKNLVTESVAISKVMVDTTTEPKADSFNFVVDNAFDLVKREFKWLDNYFVLGKYVEIKLGYTDKLETVFYGLITSINFNYPADGTPTLTIRGMDISFLMMKSKGKDAWKEKKYSEIAKSIGSKYASTMVIDDTTRKFPVVMQSKMDDFHFLLKLAKRVNREFFIVGKSMYFCKPLKKITTAVTFTWGKNLLSFSTDANIAEQVTKVVVTGWDEKNHKVIEATSKEITKLGSNSKTGKDIMKVLGEVIEYVETDLDSQAEAQDMADSLLQKKSMQLVTGSGECIGLPEIRAGKYIKIEGVGKKLNQPLYVTSAKHTINGSAGYMTSFEVGGNAI